MENYQGQPVDLVNPVGPNNSIDPSKLYQHSVEIDSSQIQYGEAKDKLTLKSSVYSAFSFMFLLDSLAILTFFFRAKPTEVSRPNRSLSLIIGLVSLFLLILIYFKQSLRRDKLWMKVIFFCFSFLNAIYLYLAFRDSYISNETYVLYGYHDYLTVALATAVFHCLYFAALAKLLRDRNEEMPLKEELLMAAASYAVVCIVCFVFVRKMSFLYYFFAAYLMLFFLIYENRRILNDLSYNLTIDDHCFVALLTLLHLFVAGLLFLLALLLLTLLLSLGSDSKV